MVTFLRYIVLIMTSRIITTGSFMSSMVRGGGGAITAEFCIFMDGPLGSDACSSAVMLMIEYGYIQAPKSAPRIK